MPAFYKVRKPTLVVVLGEGKPNLVRVEAGTVLRLKTDLTSETEVECGMGRRRIRIFRIDLEERAERLSLDTEPDGIPTVI